MEENKEAIAALLGIKTRVEKPVQTLSAILKQLGLELEYIGQFQLSKSLYIREVGTVGTKVKKHHAYQLSSESLERMKGIAERTQSQVLWMWYEKLLPQRNLLSRKQTSVDPQLVEQWQQRLTNAHQAVTEVFDRWRSIDRG